MTTRSAALLLTVLPSIPFLFGQELRSAAVAQAPAAGQTTSAESLRQIIPGHFMYSAFTAGRPFSGGIIVTSEGAVVVDALGSEAVGRAQRESVTSVIKQPVRYLVSSSFHDQVPARGTSPMRMSSRSDTTTIARALSSRCNAEARLPTSSGRACRTQLFAIA